MQRWPGSSDCIRLFFLEVYAYLTQTLLPLKCGLYLAHTCSTILGLLSVLKNSARKGTIVDSAVMPEEGSSTAEGRLESSIRKWHLSSQWLVAEPHRTCSHTHWSPARIEQCSNMPGTVLSTWVWIQLRCLAVVTKLT